MDGIGIIIWIAIIVILGKVMGKSKKTGGSPYTKTSASVNKTYTPPVYNPQAYNPASGNVQARPAQSSQAYRYGNAQSTSQTAHTKPVHTMNAQAASAKEAARINTTAAAASGTPKAAAGSAKPPKDERSTTEILKEKARLDEADHQRENRKQEMENQKNYGRLHSAERLLLGDPVPNGKRMVPCPYCGAENLIAAHDYSTKYNCYFCREVL